MESRERPPGATRPTEPLERDADESLLVPRFRLRVVSGPDRGAALTSRAERAAVGTKPANDLVLTDPTVSRYHAEVVVEDGKLLLRDLESLNGTWIAGVSIREVHLPPRSSFRLGQSEIELTPLEDPLKLPLSSRDRFGGLVGRSHVMRALFASLEKLAASDLSVLVEGETGAGKDRLAVALHEEGPRRGAPFIVVDCSSLPRDLIESELFGHEQGAFSGATERRIGAFEACSGGTLFLDAVGELPLELQPKLLRVLERRTITRVGGHHEVPVEVRVIAATSRNLQQEVNAGRFRADLFFRLAVACVRVPPLRQRSDDLELLVSQMLSELDAQTSPAARLLLGTDLRDELRRRTWPGNVRELRNYVERCLVAGQPALLEPGRGRDTPEINPGLPLRLARERWLEFFEHDYLKALLEQCGNNVSAAARAAGLDRTHLHRLLSKHGLR